MKFIVGIVIAVAMVCGVYTTKSITESIDKTSNNTASTQTDNNYNKRILGGWESSASGGSYYVFNNDNTYYWYESSSNLNDNYYKGNMEILHGTDAMDELGITLEQVTTVMSNSNYKVRINNIYCIKLNPTYLISGGVDKTNTLTDKFNMKLLFVYVDENNAQAYNYTTNDTYYLVKK